MLLLVNTTDKLQLVSSAAATLDVHVSYMDHTLSTDNVEGNRQNTAITTATTTDICAAPGAGVTRNVKTVHIRNKHASLSCDVTVVYDANATDFELCKFTLVAGAHLEYVEGVGWFVITNVDKLNIKLRLAADVINATTSFADVTGLTYPVEAGKNYGFNCYIPHQTNATTTGARFGVGGVAMTSLILGGLAQITSSVTAAAFGSTAAVTAIDTAMVVETTGPGAVIMDAMMRGTFTPSADGTFAIRCQSEVAIASALTVKAGAWLQLWEFDN